MSKIRPYFIANRRLAEHLSLNSVVLTPVQNIYRPEDPAWKTPLTKETAALIREFYNEAGKSVPDVVIETLKA